MDDESIIARIADRPTTQVEDLNSGGFINAKMFEIL